MWICCADFVVNTHLLCTPGDFKRFSCWFFKFCFPEAKRDCMIMNIYLLFIVVLGSGSIKDGPRDFVWCTIVVISYCEFFSQNKFMSYSFSTIIMNTRFSPTSLIPRLIQGIRENYEYASWSLSHSTGARSIRKVWILGIDNLRWFLESLSQFQKFEVFGGVSVGSRWPSWLCTLLLPFSSLLLPFSSFFGPCRHTRDFHVKPKL